MMLEWGFHVMGIELSTRSPIHIVRGRASQSYVVEGQSIMVVDVGFPSDAKAVLALVRNTLGRNIADIELVVLTHSHFDHVNGVDCLVDKTGAVIAAHVNAQKYLKGQRLVPRASWRQSKDFLKFLSKHGFPRPSILDAISMPWAGIPGFRKGIRSEVTHWLVDGQRLPGNEEWQALYTPGHTDDSICLYNRQYKILLSGDTIIHLGGYLRLNPLLEQNRQALLNSLEKLRKLEVDEVYPGWGPPFWGKDVLDTVRVEFS